MVVDKSNKKDQMAQDEEFGKNSGTKGGQSSDFEKSEEDMGGQDAGNMNNPQTDEG